MYTSENQSQSFIGGGLIAVGLLAFLATTTDFNIMAFAWPLFVIVPGLAMVGVAMNGGRKTHGFIYPGIIVTGTGLILMYQNVTGHWESWAYLWTLYPLFVGMAMRWSALQTGNIGQMRVGQSMVVYSTMAFVGMALFFEIMIFNASTFLALLPFFALAMVIVGIYLVLQQNSYKAKRKNDF